MSILLQSSADLARHPYWYEIIAGVLAILFLIISIAHSIVLIRKTGIEQRKLRLESQIGKRPTPARKKPSAVLARVV